MYAIGLNKEAAFHAGIRVKRIKLWLFVLSGVVCAAVGILYTFELSSAAENIGIGFELQVITIVLLGGVSIFGGRGTILGVALAAFVYAGLRSALLLTSSFNENDFQIVSGGLLILSVLVPNIAVVRHARARAGRPGCAAASRPARRWRDRTGSRWLSVRFAAVDLGAQSGRVAIGRFAGDRIDARDRSPFRQPRQSGCPMGCIGIWRSYSSRRSQGWRSPPRAEQLDGDRR